MLSVLFTLFMIWIFVKILIYGIKAAWGISELLITVVLLPLILIVLVACGLLYIAFPILIVVGIVSFISSKD